MKFRDLVAVKIQESKNNPLVESPFGFEREGTFLNRWQMNLGLASQFARFGMAYFSASNPVEIIVPTTEAGTVPLTEQEQPYGWVGKINPGLAEQAVWWAFEILTDSEANGFFREEHPRVIFRYFEQGRKRELVVRFGEDDWDVLD